jgi:hypothetical protein
MKFFEQKNEKKHIIIYLILFFLQLFFITFATDFLCFLSACKRGKEKTQFCSLNFNYQIVK